jgi:hypothetical protein
MSRALPNAEELGAVVPERPSGRRLAQAPGTVLAPVLAFSF